jgi:hypothetical protein
MNRKRYVVVPLAGAALIAAGCGSSSSHRAASAAPVPPAPAGSAPSGGMMSAVTGAQLAVLTPGQRNVVRGNNVAFDVGVSHFKVDCRFAGTANRMGTGHDHVELAASTAAC